MSDEETNDRKYLLIGDVIPNISGQTSRYRLYEWSIGLSGELEQVYLLNVTDTRRTMDFSFSS